MVSSNFRALKGESSPRSLKELDVFSCLQLEAIVGIGLLVAWGLLGHGNSK